MPADDAPPPLYSPHGPREEFPDTHNDGTELPWPQLLILPAADAIDFQKGYVGADGERAAMEGEIHVKGAQPGMWKKLSVSLRTAESAYGHEIELGACEIALSSEPLVSDSTPSSFPFSIPLMPDVPQCIHTPHSALTHVLNATLHPATPAVSVVSQDLVVHTRRYNSHTHTLDILPEKHVLDNPVRVEVEIPRSTFRVGELIPVYVTVPPPPRELVVAEGLRLRNIKTELLRTVEVKRVDDRTHQLECSWEADDTAPHEGPSSAMLSSVVEKSEDASIGSPSVFAAAYRTVISRSGASCRFHSVNPVRLRFILHQASPPASPADRPLHDGDFGYGETDPQCISITQSTLLHKVSFRLHVHISFVDTASRTERLLAIPIPITIIPPPAPLPEVEEWVGTAYQKKHDRPPIRTVRQEDMEISAPLYQEGEAGPSYTQHAAPPPFEDRDIPPPPFFSEPSSSAGLPTFQESENEIFVPSNPEDHFAVPIAGTVIIGEGVLFGFSSSQQFDGHSDTLYRSSTPPPSVEQAAQDPNVTDFADISQSQHVLGLMLEQDTSARRLDSELPPPPPLLDDPSDPPPSIDSEFRSPTSHGSIQSCTPATVPSRSYSQVRDHPENLPPREIMESSASHVHAPPPYRTPNDQEQVIRPPPYMDFIHPRSPR
ncbi:hypothetical protein F5I97DRAFT_1577829 [Phlebopus sp. FC_14]|nr:hypothetical protein F5I97DRAFT_1577829 [Phlebopus sp. FC_14]